MTTSNILINRYEDTQKTYGINSLEIVEMKLDKGASYNVARMTFVVRKGNECSVSDSGGTVAGMAELTKDFINTQKPNTLINQVLNENELKAMYRAGLRVATQPKLKLKDTIDLYCKQYINTGIAMNYVDAGHLGKRIEGKLMEMGAQK